MDDVIDFLMEFVPDVVTDLFDETINKWIKARVQNRFLWKLFYGIAILLLAAAAILATFGIVTLMQQLLS